MCSLEAARALENSIPSATLTVIPKVGHLCWVEAPTTFFSTVNEFLGL